MLKNKCHFGSLRGEEEKKPRYPPRKEEQDKTRPSLSVLFQRQGSSTRKASLFMPLNLKCSSWTIAARPLASLSLTWCIRFSLCDF